MHESTPISTNELIDMVTKSGAVFDDIAVIPICTKPKCVDTDLTMVDLADYAEVTSREWHVQRCPDGRKYVKRTDRVAGKAVATALHRVLTGEEGEHVDHVNGDGLDNRRKNLRPATRSQNGANRRRPSNNTTGYKGVILRSSGRWQAQIVVGGGKLSLGQFDTREDAARAYNVAALAAWGEFAQLNVIEAS